MRLGVTLFILLGQLYLFFRVRRYLRSLPTRRPWMEMSIIALFVLCNIPMYFVYFYFWRLTQLPADVSMFITPFYVWHIATLFIFLVLGLIALVKLPFKLSYKLFALHPFIHSKVQSMKTTSTYQKFDSSRRSFLQKGVIGLSAYSFVGASAGVVTSGEYEITKKTITIPNLPEEFKGFTIGMMSDIHSSIFMNKADMAEYVKAMNELNTDLVVVTGDMVNSKVEEVYPFAEAFSELKAKYGIYGCLGNHDYFTRNIDLVAKEIDNCGVKLLRNDAVQIKKGDAFFNLVGVDDIGRNDDPVDYMTKALAFANNNQPKILLCHKPYFFEQAKKLGCALTLSGHTHGGQIVFGTVERTPISLASLASKYVSGLYTLDDANLYVNNGIGYTGIPFRINCPAELTVITLA